MNERPHAPSAVPHDRSAPVAASINLNPSALLSLHEEVTTEHELAQRETTLDRTPARVTSSVVFVSDLSRSVRFYRDLLSCEVHVEGCGAALLLTPGGFQIYLIARGGRAPHPSGGIGLRHLIWAVDSINELNDLEQDIQARGGRT